MPAGRTREDVADAVFPVPVQAVSPLRRQRRAYAVCSDVSRLLCRQATVIASAASATDGEREDGGAGGVRSCTVFDQTHAELRVPPVFSARASTAYVYSTDGSGDFTT